MRCLPVRSVSCDDLTWSHGIALGSPVYWASVSASMKAFLDDVQKRCFGWPVSQMAWRAGLRACFWARLGVCSLSCA